MVRAVGLGLKAHRSRDTFSRRLLDELSSGPVHAVCGEGLRRLLL
jgi:hypothetical protein